MDITQILLNAQSPDPAIRNTAEQSLKQSESQNYSGFTLSLCAELCNELKPVDARRLAGLILKNSLDARDKDTRAIYSQRWLSLDEETRGQVKKNLLSALSSETKEVRHVSAQVIAKVGAVELPNSMWNNLVETLLNNITTPSTIGAKQASLEVLGYLCEESAIGNIPVQVLISQSNQILTAVVQGMRFDDPAATKEQVTEVRLAATGALLNTLDYVKENFDRGNERDFIMQTVCEAVSYPSPQIKQKALECLVRIVESYYMYLPAYITVLYNLVAEAMKASGEEEGVAMQAIEFWSTVGEEEISLAEDELAANEMNEPLPPERRSHHFVAQALPVLCPALLDCLMCQEEDMDDDTWNKSTAAGACLVVLAEAAPDTIIQNVLPFVQANIAQPSWRAREAATLAFGSIVEGPPADQLKMLVDQAVPLFVNALTNDPHVQVRDTTAWTLGRVCGISNAEFVIQKYFVALMEGFIKALTDSPPVARNAAWAIHNVAETYEHEASQQKGILSQCVEVVLRALVTASSREDANENNLRSSAYESLNTVIRCMSLDCMHYISQLVPVMLERLEMTIPAASSAIGEEAREEISELQGLLCGVLQTATQRLGGQGISVYADRLMQAYLGVLGIGSNIQQKAKDPSGSISVSGMTGSVHEEALMAVGALADAMEMQFVKYLPHFAPYLLLGLRNWEQYQVCAVAVGVVGDISRAVEKAIVPFGDDIVALLLTALQSSELDKSVKPPILSCFGDLALAIGGEFERYVPHVMAMLQQAAQSSLQLDIAPEDYDMQDWVFALRESIFEAYTGILQGLKHDNRQSLLQPHVSWMVSFCEIVFHDCDPQADGSSISGNSSVGLIPESEKLVGAAAGVLGDIATLIDGVRGQLLLLSWVSVLVDRAQNSVDNRVRDCGVWAKHAIFGAS